jgi:predicted amidohydrolase
MNAFFESSHFEELNPIEFALEVLQRMKHRYSLHVVTARQHKVETDTRAWLNKHFPDIFEEIHFGNHYCNSGKSRSKAEICKSINAQLLIDDSMIYATQCALENINVILFGKYPWNQVIESASSHFHDITVVFNAHEKNEVVIQDFHEALCDEDRAIEQIANGTRYVYRVGSWLQMEQAVSYMLASVNRARELDLGLAPVTTLPVGREQLYIAAIQMCSKNDKVHNLARTKALVEQALLEEPQLTLLCLPECTAFLGNTAIETVTHAEILQLENGYISQLQALAKEKHVWLSVGGFAESFGQDKMCNAHLLINRDGQVVQPIYRKIHLFDCPLVGLQESKLTAPGQEVVVLQLEGWNIGLTVCYDLRFPALFQVLQNISNTSMAAGLDLILVPAAFTVPTGIAHWELLLRARAVENQCYIIAAAQSGQHNEKRVSYGHSMVVDPWGKIVSQLYSEEEGICHAVLEKKRIKEVRASMPLQQHQRLDVYNKYRL